MRVIFVNIMMGMYRGGGENFDLNLSREVTARGHQVDLYHLRPLTRPAQLPLPSHVTPRPVRAPWLYFLTQRMHDVPGLRHLRGVRGLPRIIGQLTFELRTFARLFGRRREGPMVVWICGLPLVGALVSRVLGWPCYVRFPGPPSHPFQRWLMRRCYALVANGDAYRQIAALQLRGPRLLRLEVGVDRSLFHPADEPRAEKAALGLRPDRRHVLWVGRLVAVKNLPLLLEAMGSVFAAAPDVDLVLVGDGPLREALHERVRAEGWEGRVVWAGERKRDDLARYYRAADLFALSSGYDNFPNVVVEAMASRLPVVATAVGGVDLQVEDGVTGFLVAPGNAEALAAALLRLVRDGALRARLGRAGYQRAREHFDWARTAREFLDAAGAATTPPPPGGTHALLPAAD